MEEEKQIILNLVNQWRLALDNRDLDALLENYHPDCVLFDLKPPHRLNGVAKIRKAWEECLPYFPEKFTSKHRDLEVTVVGDMALLHGYHRFIALSDLEKWKDVLHDIRVTVCYQKINGKWLVIHEHVSMPYDPMTGQMVKFE